MIDGCRQSWAAAGRRPGAAGRRPTSIPAVHDMPPPRPTAPLTEEQQVRLEKELQRGARPAGSARLPRPPKNPLPTRPTAAKKSPPTANNGQTRVPVAPRPTRDKSLPGSRLPAGQRQRRRPKGLTDGRFLPHPPPAALRVRRGEPGQGARPQCGRRHHRSRHGQSGSAGARACHREAEGDARQAAHRPLFGLARHSRACAARRRPITSAASA